VVRRTRLVDPIQAQLWPDGRYHAFITSLDLPVVETDQFHRDHATVELAIRDLKEGAGLAHCPSGKFFANAAWLACAVLAHNLVRWTARLGDVHSHEQLTVTRTIRIRLITLPGRVVNRSGRHTLRLPARWPWADAFLTALARLRAIPLIT
jgi:Transposase DDE domain group 1